MKKNVPTKIENNMKENKLIISNVEDFINNTHKLIKEQHKQNIYPKDIRGLFERLGIE